jgi:hypothetical protein
MQEPREGSSASLLEGSSAPLLHRSTNRHSELLEHPNACKPADGDGSSYDRVLASLKKAVSSLPSHTAVHAHAQAQAQAQHAPPTKTEGDRNPKKRKCVDAGGECIENCVSAGYLQADEGSHQGNSRPVLCSTLSGPPLQQDEAWSLALQQKQSEGWAPSATVTTAAAAAAATTTAATTATTTANELRTPSPRHTGLGIDATANTSSIPVHELVAPGASATVHGFDPTPDRTCCLDVSKQASMGMRVGSFAMPYARCASGPAPKPSHMEAAHMLVALGGVDGKPQPALGGAAAHGAGAATGSTAATRRV